VAGRGLAAAGGNVSQQTAALSRSPSGLVSIVVPAYRADRYLGESLGSIARQEYRDWELIVVEDGSLGETERLVRAFAERMPPEHRVVYLRHETNRGPSAARNTALGQARGELVAFLDADDVWRETHLTSAVEALSREPADVAFSTALMFEDGTGHLIGLWGPTRERLLAARPALRTFPNWLYHRNFIIPSASVVRRRALDSVGGFDPELRLSEDLDLWLRCVKAGMTFVHIPGCHCLHRKGHAGTATGDLAAILRAQASVLEKHVGLPTMTRGLERSQVAYFYTAAGLFFLETDASAASQLFFQGWRVRPLRLDLLLLAAWARVVLPYLPDFGLVRRFKRARGY